jgi:hypothetical protein
MVEEKTRKLDCNNLHFTLFWFQCV